MEIPKKRSFCVLVCLVCCAAIFFSTYSLHRVLIYNATPDTDPASANASSTIKNNTLEVNPNSCKDNTAFYPSSFKSNDIEIFSKTVEMSDMDPTYLVYDCSKRHKGRCGGFSDRLSGMLSLYVISILTGKRFLIHHDDPCQLSKYLLPNKYDWRYDKIKIMGRNQTFADYFCKMPSLLKNHSISKLKTAFPADVNFVRMNWDYANHFKEIKNISKLVPWITQLHISDMYADFFNFLFKPEVSIISEVENILSKRKRKLACAHIRIGNNPTMPTDDFRYDPFKIGEIWSFLIDMEKRDYDIFVATDAEIVKLKAEELFKDNLISVPGEITHLDKTKQGNLCAGLRKSLLDFFLLTKCQELILTSSGFGMTAAYLNKKNTPSAENFCSVVSQPRYWNELGTALSSKSYSHFPVMSRGFYEYYLAKQKDM